ncbi:hypothetical protein MMF93_21185 [Streptomyces tubbatahanensis]|uniref:Transposase n=1 Tax=Streptomyces tubbatahanensis TaxID=2923272 RepID=A0ABY3XWJ5_9ACTN|nr:hypothetical protein [Streptomyces tubbatahanensis]UNS98691.1 hypothetical protein MMF93_21185 [Streptomyces tubbatahanensis]
MKNGSYFPGRGTLVEETFLKGKAQGMAEGMAAGQAEGQARSVLRLLEMRGIPVTETQRARLAACTDPEVLDTWLERAVRITDADQLFESEPPPRSPAADRHVGAG